MDKRLDFGQDLATLTENVDAGVGDVLELLRQKRASGRKVVAIKGENMGNEAERAAADSASAESQNEAAQSDRRRRARTQVLPRTKSTLQDQIVKANFTTRLRPETKELLEEAKLRQKLKRQLPDGYEEIIDEALQDWFRKNGYAPKRPLQE
jgi:hypothetical protein